MQVHAGMDPRLPLGEVGPYARRIEALGFEALGFDGHVAETVHDGVALPPLGDPGADEAVAGLVARLQAG